MKMDCLFQFNFELACLTALIFLFYQGQKKVNCGSQIKKMTS